MFQTLSFAEPICRQAQRQQPRPEHYAITPMVTNRPCVIQPAKEDPEDEGEFEAGYFAIFPCDGEGDGSEPIIKVEWDAQGRIITKKSAEQLENAQVHRSGCGGGSGS